MSNSDTVHGADVLLFCADVSCVIVPHSSARWTTHINWSISVCLSGC